MSLESHKVLENDCSSFTHFNAITIFKSPKKLKLQYFRYSLKIYGILCGHPAHQTTAFFRNVVMPHTRPQFHTLIVKYKAGWKTKQYDGEAQRKKPFPKKN